ncbi:hypothetical protein HanIR_Chr12g0587101 [Helianthus annuus]|nr:hypothetical protein HanIR_Chr12g0587101 [Helianthus annuus]
MLPTTCMVEKEGTPVSAWMEIRGSSFVVSITVSSSCEICSVSPSSLISSMYSCLFGHLWVDENFSGHQKHSPLNLLASISLWGRFSLFLLAFNLWLSGGDGNKGK